MTAGWVRPDWVRERSGLKGLMDARGGIRFVLVLEHYRHSQPLPTATCSAGSGLWLGTLLHPSRSPDSVPQIRFFGPSSVVLLMR